MNKPTLYYKQDIMLTWPQSFIGLYFILFTIAACSSSGQKGIVYLPLTHQDTFNTLFDTAASLQLLSKQFAFTEGPATDKKGNVFFTDQPNNKIWQYGTDGKLTLFLDSAGRSNGMYFDQAGKLISCADENNQLWEIAPDKKVKVLATDVDGKKLNGPNDVWVDRNTGGIYFTDPYYQRDYWKRKQTELTGMYVYYLPPGAKEAIVVSSYLKKPNGIVGTPDGKYLYVADIGNDKTYRFARKANGYLDTPQLIIHQGSDGMTIDKQGNIYLTGKGVTVYNATGSKIAHIDVPEPWTANLCFCGKKRNLLFITASTAIYLLKMKVEGIE
jgi:gluconolactonase